VTEGRAGARLRMLAFLVVLMFGALSIRLWYLQVLASDEFAQEATQNGIRLVETPAVRGKILDDTGRHLLVDNRLSLEVTVNEQALGNDAEAVIYRLHELLHMPVGIIRAKLRDPRYYDYQPVPIAVDVPNKVAYYIGEHQADFPGVTWQKTPVRTYPFGELAAHILGYTGQITRSELKEQFFKSYDQNDQVGQSGLERQYEKYLQGKKGVVKYRVNAAGKNLGTT
jgi:penicillin-binding protein 2